MAAGDAAAAAAAELEEELPPCSGGDECMEKLNYYLLRDAEN